MNILCDTLPSSVVFEGKKYELNTDFSVWLRFHSIMSDKNLSWQDKFLLSVVNCFDSAKCLSLPPDSEKTIAALMKFFCGNEISKSSDYNNHTTKIFDFSEDADYIYAAFLQEYSIDLTKTSMHWYKFLSLLKGLTRRTQFVKIMEYRSVNLDDIEDEKKRSFYRKMKKIYALSNDFKMDEFNIAQKLSEVF